MSTWALDRQRGGLGRSLLIVASEGRLRARQGPVHRRSHRQDAGIGWSAPRGCLTLGSPPNHVFRLTLWGTATWCVGMVSHRRRCRLPVAVADASPVQTRRRAPRSVRACVGPAPTSRTLTRRAGGATGKVGSRPPGWVRGHARVHWFVEGQERWGSEAPQRVPRSVATNAIGWRRANRSENRPRPIETSMDRGLGNVELRGIEPLTSSLRTTRSTN